MKTNQQLVDEALQDYANENGRSWKSKLIMEDWPRCQPVGILIALRNSSWGMDYVENSDIKPCLKPFVTRS